jgi:1-aminocyclopropane-1-carboxylate deaminase
MEKIDFSNFDLSFDRKIRFDHAILQSLSFKDFGDKEVFIQRDDLIHPIISGNKWRKLEGWVRYARENGFHTLVTFGGAFSNHLVATAAAGYQLGFKTIGLLRADEHIENHYLSIAKAYGMQVIGVSRELYREKTQLLNEYASLEGHLVIPEGGQGEFAFEGFESLIASFDQPINFIVHASATATTAVGLALAIQKMNLNIRIKSILVLKNLQSQLDYAREYGVDGMIDFVDGFHFGGYAKVTPDLLRFNDHFSDETQILIDPVYAAKALWALREMIHCNEIDGKIAFLHTGGMLGRFSDKFQNIQKR